MLASIVIDRFILSTLSARAVPQAKKTATDNIVILPKKVITIVKAKLVLEVQQLVHPLKNMRENLYAE